MLTAPRPDYLATADERTLLERIDAIEASCGKPAREARRQLERLDRLRGALTWRLRDRVSRAAHGRRTSTCSSSTSTSMRLKARYGAFVRARQAATHSYVGYDAGIARLRDRVDAALQRVTIVMARQGHVIETVAIDELRARRERLVAQQTQARFAVADSYDRARASQPAEAGQ